MDSLPQVNKIITPLILSYIQEKPHTTKEIAQRLSDEGRFIPAFLINIYVDELRHEHNICTEGDYHYIPKESTSKIVMLSTVVIGGLFLCPFLLNL